METLTSCHRPPFSWILTRAPFVEPNEQPRTLLSDEYDVTNIVSCSSRHRRSTSERYLTTASPPSLVRQRPQSLGWLVPIAGSRVRERLRSQCQYQCSQSLLSTPPHWLLQPLIRLYLIKRAVQNPPGTRRHMEARMEKTLWSFGWREVRAEGMRKIQRNSTSIHTSMPLSQVRILVKSATLI